MALTSNVAPITGDVKNLGAQSALELAGIGAKLTLHYYLLTSIEVKSALKATVREKIPSIKVSFYQSDLTFVTTVTKLFEDFVRDFGHVDIVINTVGKVLKKPIIKITEEEYDIIFA